LISRGSWLFIINLIWPLESLRAMAEALGDGDLVSIANS